MAACGLAAGMALNTTVAPFILRGVTLGRQTTFLSGSPQSGYFLDMVKSSRCGSLVLNAVGVKGHALLKKNPGLLRGCEKFLIARVFLGITYNFTD